MGVATRGRRQLGLRGKVGRFIATDPTWLVIALVFGAALAIGGVHPLTRAILALGALGALGWVWLRSAWRGRRLPVEGMGLGLLVALCWTFIQWVPLPAAVVATLAPQAADASIIAAKTSGSSIPQFLSMSLAPTRTALSWLTLAGYTAVFLVAADVARRRRGRSLLLAIEGVALLVLLTGVVHAMAGTSAIYGFYSPETVLPWRVFTTSFINPNHAAALLMLGAVVALGLWLEAETKTRGQLFVAALLGAGVVATGSRGNLAVLMMAWTALLALGWRRHRAGGTGNSPGNVRSARVWLLVLMGASLAVGLASALLPGLWAGNPAATAHLSDVGARWDVGLTVASEHLWTGAGMGAFHTVAAAAMPGFQHGLLDHAHNLGLQMLVDWGLPATCVVVGLGLAGFARSMRLVWANIGLVGVGVALMGLVVQNMVDFSAYIPGVGYSAAVLAGVLSGSEELMPPRSTTRREQRWPRISLASAGILALVLATVLTASHAIKSGRSGYHERAAAAITDGAPRRVDIATLLVHHPHDYYAFRIAGRLALADGRPGHARAFFTRAVELAPRHSGIRLDLARTSIAEGAEVTAVDHLVAASEAGPKGRRQAARLVAKLPAQSGAMAQFIASSPANASAVVYFLSRTGKRKKARAIAERSLNFHPSHPRMWRRVLEMADSARDVPRLARLSMAALKRGAGKKGDEARQWLTLGHWAQALVSEYGGETKRAQQAVRDARQYASDAEQLHLRLIEASLAAKAQDWSALRLLLRGLESRLGSSAALAGRFHQLSARLAEADGRIRVAISHIHRALVFLPNEPNSRRVLTRLRARRDTPDGP